MQTRQSIRWSHIWQRKRISGQQESLVLIRLSSDKRLRWTCAALWIFFASRINGTHTANRACTWDSDTVTKAQASLCKCADSPEPSLLEHRFIFEPTLDILELWRIIRWACFLEHFLLAKMTPKSPFERAQGFDTYRIVKWLYIYTAMASLHICADSFAWAFATVLKCHVFDQMVIGLPLIRAAKAWRVCTFAWVTQQCDCEGKSAQVCAESPESSSLDNALSTKVSRWLKRRRTFEWIEKTNEWEKRTFERQKSGLLSEMKNNPFQRITYIPVCWCPFR